MARRKAPERAEIKKSLEKQLEAKGANTAHFYDVICDYMALYDTKNRLKEDIERRGVSYETTSASGYKIIKQNQSVKDLIAVEKQMLVILRELGLTTDAPTGKNKIDENL